MSLISFGSTAVMIVVGLWWCLASAAHALEYHLGQGLQAGPVNVGGYINLVGEGPHHGTAKLALDDLSLFLSARFNRWLQPFIEAELAEQPLWTEHHGAFSPDRGRWVVERAYNDLSPAAGWRLRLGKMLAPVGQWNLIHAAPLVMTTLRPLTTFRNFSTFASGAAIIGGPQDRFFLYYQPWGELAQLPKKFLPRRYRQVAGGRWVFGDTVDQWLGLGIQAAERRPHHHWQTLFSLDGGAAWGRLSMEFQATYNHLYGDGHNHRTTHEWGAYLQAAWRFHHHWSAVARVEGYRDRDASAPHRSQLAGLVFHPHPAVKWKLEYLWTQGPSLGRHEGIFGSLAVLF